jgi:hypothetical protein
LCLSLVTPTRLMMCSVRKKAQTMRAKAKKRNGTNGTGFGLPSLQPFPKGLTAQQIRMSAETIKRSVYTFYSVTLVRANPHNTYNVKPARPIPEYAVHSGAWLSTMRKGTVWLLTQPQKRTKCAATCWILQTRRTIRRHALPMPEGTPLYNRAVPGASQHVR